MIAAVSSRIRSRTALMACVVIALALPGCELLYELLEPDREPVGRVALPKGQSHVDLSLNLPTYSLTLTVWISGAVPGRDPAPRVEYLAGEAGNLSWQPLDVGTFHCERPDADGDRRCEVWPARDLPHGWQTLRFVAPEGAAVRGVDLSKYVDW